MKRRLLGHNLALYALYYLLILNVTTTMSPSMQCAHEWSCLILAQPLHAQADMHPSAPLLFLTI
jgi:hypothetical protein